MWLKFINLNRIEGFLIRCIVIFIFILISQLILFNYIKSSINNEDSFKIKNYFKGLITNPEVFYIRAEILYNQKKYIKAKVEINLALGILHYRCDSNTQKICLLSRKIDEAIRVQNN